MNKKIENFIELALWGFFLVLAIGFFLKNPKSIIKFTLAYYLLFYIPILIWVTNLKITKVSKLVLTNIIGICLIPILFAIIGSFTSLNTTLFILPSVIVAILGISYTKKK